MASAMKFLYYSQPRTRPRRTLSNAGDDNQLEEFKRRFRRSGSLGIPFVPEEDVLVLRRELAITEDDEGQVVLTVIIKSLRAPDSVASVLSSLPSKTRIRHVETRDDEKSTNQIEVLLEMELPHGLTKDEAILHIKTHGMQVREISHTVAPSAPTKFAEAGANGSQWFPKSIHDLDLCAKKVIMYGAGLDADHPGFKDAEYRKRRMMFADIALTYKHGEPIPRVEYTEVEKNTWRVIYRTLRALHLQYACDEFLHNFEQLELHCGYSEHNIPQLEDISKFLRAKTGFRVRPVAGYLSARDFLAALAFRVFFCTQYVRHQENPFYTPEPDTVHELMGHMALFADADFAQFSQEIGLASLGASEEDLNKLATLYFFSIEFGLSSDSHADKLQGDALYKVYGAGLLSSAGELKHAIEGSPDIFRFDPERVVEQECLITTFQAAYFYTRNFEEAQQKLRMFTSSMKRPFVVRYNAYTESIEVLNNKQSLVSAVNSLRSDINLLASALHYVL